MSARRAGDVRAPQHERGLQFFGGLQDIISPIRLMALGAIALLLSASLSVLYYVSNVAGSPGLLLALTAGSALAGVAVGRVLRPRAALLVAVALLIAGVYGYLQTLPQGVTVLAAVDPILRDTVALLTGLSVLRIVNAEVWALAITPAPVFLVSYLAVRRHYPGAVAVGGLLLGMFILTGDAGITTALLGVVGAAAAVGLGDIERRQGTLAGVEVVAVLVAVMVVVTLTVNVVPAGAGGAAPGGGGGGGGGTIEASLVNAGDSIRIQGSIELSPAVRFAVTSDEPRYWRVGSYDRYTGGGWVRTGGTRPYDGPLRSPLGNSRSVRQVYEPEERLSIMPAAWKPRQYSGSVGARVTDDGGLRPADTVGPGDSYTVESRVPVARPAVLRDAGTEYPTAIRERYVQLPASTPDRVGERTTRITANAETPYETALVVEQWLKNNRDYSLDVDRPRGDIAEAFLFEMDAGYCTYFATTMVAMLRSQGIPARLAVGYTTGERVAEDRWVARGLNSHAWVEVFFPGVGWIQFDPTPAGPREQVEQNAVDTARANENPNVDSEETGPEEWSPTPATPLTETTENGSEPTTPPGGFIPGGNLTPTPTPPPGGQLATTAGDDDSGLPSLPSRKQMALGMVVLLGAAAGARRSGLASRTYREVWLRYQPRNPDDPARDIERAYKRLEYLLQRRGYERSRGETRRQFLTRVNDTRARRVGELAERSRYAGVASPEDADVAVSLVDELVAERSVFWFGR